MVMSHPCSLKVYQVGFCIRNLRRFLRILEQSEAFMSSGVGDEGDNHGLDLFA